ncbi:MAG: FGGY family carbohydrate kinase [Kiritimatiellia bacterium]|jgi:xylulokinase|nr:FGGY family carbohydrate kinase [Kiritimatiellia bacterium]
MGPKDKTGDLLIGFDLGTSAMKALLSDSEGRIVGQASRQVDTLRPEATIVELDAEAYFQDICSVIGELVSKTDDPKQVVAISFSGASGNTVLLDKDYSPLEKVISWLDTRTAGAETELWPELAPESIYHSAGWPFGGTFPLAHLAWYKRFKPDVWKKARHFTMLNDYIYHRLCGRLAVDYSKATTFYLQNQEERKWNKDLLYFLGIEEYGLSELLPPGSVCGTVTPEAAQATGLQTDTLVVTGSFDHPSAARSTGVFEEGELLISAGTSWVVFAPIRKRETGLNGRMLVDPFLSPSGCWGSMSALTAVAEKMNEYLENCIGSNGGESLPERYDRLAAEAEPGANGFYLELFKQPYEQMKEQVEEVAPRNIARALMEGIVFLTRNRIDKLSRMTGKPAGRIVLTGGATKSPVWPSIIADVLNRPVAIPETGQHAGAMGAVVFAGMGAGVYRDERDGYEKIKPKEIVIEPDPVRSKLYQRIYKDYSDRFDLSDGTDGDRYGRNESAESVAETPVLRDQCEELYIRG